MKPLRNSTYETQLGASSTAVSWNKFSSQTTANFKTASTTLTYAAMFAFAKKCVSLISQAPML